MIGFIAGRVGVTIPSLIGVTIVVFLMLHLIPGDPAEILLSGTNPTAAELARVRAQMGLNEPLVVQYLAYIWHLLHGNLGESYSTNQPIVVELGERLPSTIQLTVAGMIVAILVGVPVGIIGGLFPGTPWDMVARAVAVLGVAVPSFWLALLLILMFAVRLNWLPSLGEGPPQSIVLPAVSLGWAFAAVIARLLRRNLIEVYRELYIRAAEAKGLAPSTILLRHVLKNSINPVITIVGLQIGNMLAGTVVVESVFGRPGLGSYLVSAIESKNIPAVQGAVLVIAVIYLLINLAVDVIHGLLDPRVRVGWA